MSDTFINIISKILEHKDFKSNIKLFLKPLIDSILNEIYPYLYIISAFIVICFLLILAILTVLLQYKHKGFF